MTAQTELKILNSIMVEDAIWTFEKVALLQRPNFFSSNLLILNHILKAHTTMHKNVLLAIALLGTSFLHAQRNTGIVTPDAKMHAFVSALMKKMTVQEKIGQLN